MKTLILLLSVSLISGCATCTLEEAEELVGACEKQKEIVPGPPEKIYLVMPTISAPPPYELQCEQWTDEEIKADPVGYEEAMWNDILALVDRDIATIDYINQLERARARLEAQANSEVGGEHEE